MWPKENGQARIWTWIYSCMWSWIQRYGAASPGGLPLWKALFHWRPWVYRKWENRGSHEKWSQEGVTIIPRNSKRTIYKREKIREKSRRGLSALLVSHDRCFPLQVPGSRFQERLRVMQCSKSCDFYCMHCTIVRWAGMNTPSRITELLLVLSLIESHIVKLYYYCPQLYEAHCLNLDVIWRKSSYSRFLNSFLYICNYLPTIPRWKAYEVKLSINPNWTYK